MTISLHTDSDSKTHQIWAQRQANSCSVASIWMARGIVRQMTMEEGEWALAHRMYHTAVAGMCWVDGPPATPAPQTWDQGSFTVDQSSVANTFAAMGVYGHQVANMLREEGLKVAHVTHSGTALTINPAKLTPNKPAIVLVGWVRNGQIAGGHFVVAARRAFNGRIVYLDPWGGVLREIPNDGRYPGNGLILEIIYVRE